MSKNVLITVKKELRGIVRDKKSLLTMLLIPLMIPVIIFLCSYIFDSVQNNTKTYTIGLTYDITETEKEILNELKLETIKYDSINSAKDAYNKGEIIAYIDKIDNNYTIYSKQKSNSQEIYVIQDYLEAYNNYLALDYLSEIEADPNRVYSNINYTFEDVSGGNMLTSMIISFSIMFAMMSITMTAITCATDIIAGEKEKGTLETILTFPIKTNEFIMGKYISIVIVSVLTSLLSLILMSGSMYIAQNSFEVYKDISLNIDFSMIIYMFLIMCTYALFISGACIAIASSSKTFKEAQSALQPLSLISLVPMFMNMLGIGITTLIAFIPGVGPTVLLDSILNNGIRNGDILNLVIVVLSTLVYAVILVHFISKQYKDEKILFSN